MNRELFIKAEEYIHLTCNSGLRLKADDPRFERVQHPVKPFVVVESQNGYTPIVAEQKLEIASHTDGAVIKSDSLEVMPVLASLDKAVEVYLKKYPLSDTSGRAAHLKRAITLDMWLPDGRIAHNYEDAIRLIEELDNKELADGTLLYIPGWHSPYDTQYPAYAPSDELGGTVMFREMLESADKAGVTIMPHLNYWAYDVKSGLIDDYADFQVRNEQGQPMGWAGTMKTGYTNPLAYMRVDDPRWQKIFWNYLEPLLNNFPIKALFMDQIGFWNQGAAFDDATEAILCRLRRITPDLLLGGEGLSDKLITHIDISQAWGQPWCGLDVDFTDSFSPIIAIMFKDKVKFMSHLGLPCAKPCRYCWTNYPFIVERGYEKAFELGQKHAHQMGGLAHVRLNYNAYGIDQQSLDVLKFL